ncbi:hypothetical protein [Oryza sativa Japonica Group]|uniref:Uncharacterized protein n=1 Tax=Oryza sativa subsp. japonica TaxID=39947 RepID=Q94CW1_ORYSJ|nr:hypothetical protein [Oryza sativa Japonica Group]
MRNKPSPITSSSQPIRLLPWRYAAGFHPSAHQLTTTATRARTLPSSEPVNREETAHAGTSRALGRVRAAPALARPPKTPPLGQAGGGGSRSMRHAEAEILLFALRARADQQNANDKTPAPCRAPQRDRIHGPPGGWMDRRVPSKSLDTSNRRMIGTRMSRVQGETCES